MAISELVNDSSKNNILRISFSSYRKKYVPKLKKKMWSRSQLGGENIKSEESMTTSDHVKTSNWDNLSIIGGIYAYQLMGTWDAVEENMTLTEKNYTFMSQYIMSPCKESITQSDKNLSCEYYSVVSLCWCRWKQKINVRLCFTFCYVVCLSVVIYELFFSYRW